MPKLDHAPPKTPERSVGEVLVHRVLPAEPVPTLEAYVADGGGKALEAARQVEPDAVIATVVDAGLRGRGGAGFPTGTKWQTVRANASASQRSTVVVNAAEGEPSTLKDRTILDRTPYSVLEGALIAARAVGADRVVVALKEHEEELRRRIDGAVAEVVAAGWCTDASIEVVEGPRHYLFGEETGLLEVLDGRPPFPRVTPPFRRGLDGAGEDTSGPARAVLAGEGGGGTAPTLVNNVETLANIPGIVLQGPAWFRSLGTDGSPGTVVCTVIGAVERPGIGEVAFGTPLWSVIEAIGGGAKEGRHLVGALSGVANALLPEEHFHTPLTYEDLQDLGTGIGAAGFLVFDDETDMAAVAAGIARFLAIESCGQCTPCKQDGLQIADHLQRICGVEGNDFDIVGLLDRLGSVADEARCSLASQQQVVIGSILDRFSDHLQDHVDGRRLPVKPMLVTTLLELDDDGAVLEEEWLAKQPDWSFDPVDSGRTPKERLGGPAEEEVTTS